MAALSVIGIPLNQVCPVMIDSISGLMNNITPTQVGLLMQKLLYGTMKI